MQIRRRSFIQLLALDLIAILVVFNAIGWLRGVLLPGDWFMWPLVAPAVFFATAIYLIDGYRLRTDMVSVDYTSQHLIATLAAMTGMLVLTYVIIIRGFPLQQSRAVITLSFLALIPVTISYRRWLHTRHRTAREDRVIVFLGDRASCETFRDEAREQRLGQRIVYSLIAPTPPATMPTGVEIRHDSLRPYDEVINEIMDGRLRVEAIVLRESGTELPADVAHRLILLYFKGVPSFTLELFHQVYWRKIPLYRLNQTWLFQEGFQIAREPVFERLKRVLDVSLAAAGLLVASPLLALAALAIRLDDGGPVFFRQTRIGRNRTPFQLVKFRTMKTAPAADDPVAEDPTARYTQKNDPRITRVGRFLRATRLDEFPQLWNVLRGEMSMIGPRAEWSLLVEDYERQIPCYHFRHLVRPGITGWAQVNYPYGANLEDTQRKLEYDLYYIRHFSFIVDASIILKTVHIMLFGKGR